VPDVVEPRGLGPSDWQQIAQVMVDLYLCVALGVNAALAVLLGFGVLPSLVDSLDVPAGVLRWRRWLVSVAAVSAALMVVALARGLSLAIATIQHVYPRLGV
jgi:hypothetical protein